MADPLLEVWRNKVATRRPGLWAALVTVALLALAPLASAQPAPTAPSPAPSPAPAHIAAALVVEAPARPGATTSVALVMRPAPGWHGYWSNPGDAGFAMQVTWRVPAGATVGTLLYPVPQVLLIGGLMNHVYASDYAVLAPLTLPSAARAGDRLPISASAQWLACSATICVPEHAKLHATVTVATPSEVIATDPRFDTWRALLPAPLAAEAHYAVAGGTLRLALPFPATARITAPHLFAEQDRIVDYPAPQSFARAGDVLVIALLRAAGNPPVPASWSGVLRLGAAGDGLRFTATPGRVPAGGVALEPARDIPPALDRLPWLLLAALAGGLLLNVMPCVFPILSLKALSLARAGGDGRVARREALAYSAGVILACLALGGLLLALRAGGSAVGWAFQLQEPGVVAALLVLALAITANLLGLFEFAVPGFATRGASGHGLRGAFATGLLAAFVATPCTGPFMAGAMGAALLLPVAAGLALFAALGLGIALPFLAIGFAPALRRLLPRPGPWMGWFRRLMAVPMALTALALAWLASRLAGWSFALAAVALAAGVLAILAWIGREQRAGRTVAVPALAGLAGLALIAALGLPMTVRAPRADAPDLLESRPFSEPALAEARAAHHPVFVYFTADWCLTCKVNERLAIERAPTRAAFARAGVVVLKGDWTRRDPAITRFLTAQGAAGVPLYLWYRADGDAAVMLPQVLTANILPTLAAR